MAEAEVGSNPYGQLIKRFGITLLLGVVVYRLGAIVPVPGINVERLGQLIGEGGGIMQWANMFNGGAIANGSLFGLGIMPYISASIIIQLMAFSFPALKQLQKEGEVGRRKINQYTRYTTVAICAVQALVAGIALTRITHEQQSLIEPDMSSVYFVVQFVLIVTTGSMVLLWLAEQITKHGIGNGVSVIIMIGILASFAPTIANMQGDLKDYLLLISLFVAIVAALVVLTQARRFINMEQQRRVQGNRVYGGAQTKLPMMLNHAGVIPVIFASPVMVVVGLIFSAQFLPEDWRMSALVEHGGPGYRYIFAAIIFFFTYFYISITVDLNDWASNFRQSGFFVRGIRPGRNTAEYLRRILRRITFVGAISLAAVTIFPSLLGGMFFSEMVAQMVLGGVGLLIVVGVSLDVIQKVSSFLLAHQYQGMVAGTGKPAKSGKSSKGLSGGPGIGSKTAAKRF